MHLADVAVGADDDRLPLVVARGRGRRTACPMAPSGSLTRRNGSFQCSVKPLVRVERVGRHADEDRAGLGERLPRVAERARLLGAAGRLVLRVEVDDDGLALERGEVNGRPVLGGRGEVGRGLCRRGDRRSPRGTPGATMPPARPPRAMRPPRGPRKPRARSRRRRRGRRRSTPGRRSERGCSRPEGREGEGLGRRHFLRTSANALRHALRRTLPARQRSEDPELLEPPVKRAPRDADHLRGLRRGSSCRRSGR